ncbi:hypothetical protein HYU14_05750 [Candidatus Woesearchaeota archaeon]|nr:hypothetical protein [Candidatus Woesearchaeota archaeon]
MKSSHPAIFLSFLGAVVLLLAFYVIDISTQPRAIRPADEQPAADGLDSEESAMPEGAASAASPTAPEEISSDSNESGQGSQSLQPPEELRSPPSTISEVKEGAEGIVTVEIKDMRLNPQEVSIYPGTTVQWVSYDNFAHKLYAVDRTFYGTRMETGDTFSYTFTKPGTYRYFDANFEKFTELRGTITVKDIESINQITGNAVAEGNAADESNGKLAVVLLMSALLGVSASSYFRKKRYH